MTPKHRYSAEEMLDIASRIENNVPLFGEATGLPEMLRQAASTEAQVMGLVEVVNLALEYWKHRQQRYKNRSPVWVEKANEALSKLRGES